MAASARPARAAVPVEKAGPAHIATLKTFDPPLSALEGERPARRRRRAKRFLFPTDDGELVADGAPDERGAPEVHPAGRQGREDADVPAALRRRRRAAADRGRLEEARGRLAAPTRRSSRPSSRTSAPRPTSSMSSARRILASDSRRLHSLLRDQRLIAGIGRAWANEILWAAQALAVRALDAGRRRGDRSGSTRRSATSSPRARAAAARARTTRDLPRAQPARRAVRALRHADRARRLRGAHDLLLPACQTDGRVLKDRRLSRLLK